MHANVACRFGRGLLDALGNKGLAAYLIARDLGLRAHVETTDAPKAAALVPWSDADLLLQCPQITKAEGGHIANACSRLATKSYDSMPALLRSPARRDEPVSAG